MHPAAWPVIAFLAGSIPFGYLVARAHGVDIRSVGSGNIGATNVGRALGKRWARIVFALDFLKGLLPTLAAGFALHQLPSPKADAANAWWWATAALAAVLGHVFTPWLGFRGGKGVATGTGVVLGCFPLLSVAGVVAGIVWKISFSMTRTVSIASLAAATTLPVGTLGAVFVRSRVSDTAPSAWPVVALAGGLSVLVWLSHRSNIRRIIAGTEPRIPRGERG